MARPKKLIGELRARAEQMLQSGTKRGVICKELKVSYKQLENEFGNVWKQRQDAIGAVSSDSASAGAI